MSNLLTLEAQRNLKISQDVITMGHRLGKETKRFSIANRIVKSAEDFQYSKLTISELHKVVEKAHNSLYDFFRNKVVIKDEPRMPWDKRYAFRTELKPEFAQLDADLFKLTQELSTVHPTSVGSRYRVGTVPHGVLAALVTRNGCRAIEIKAFFPSLNDSSTLTHMRREGLIEKSGGQTSPFVATELGKQLLKERGAYTATMYQKFTGTNLVPWDLKGADYDKFVKDNTRSSRNYC